MGPLYSTGTVADLFRGAFQTYGTREALVSGQLRWTYDQLADRCHRLVRYWASMGLRQQDSVALLCGNCPEAVVVIIAAQLMGLRYTALHPLGALDDQLFVLEDAGIGTLIVDAQRHGERGAALASGAKLQHVFTFSDAPFGVDMISASSKLDAADMHFPVEPEDVSRISYTGGTTGRSKGVLHAQRTTITMTLQQLACWEWPQEIRCLIATPISHAGGTMMLPTFMRGGTIYFLEKYTPESFLDAVQTHRITTTFLVPTQIYGLLDCPTLKQHDTSSLEFILYGASPIAPARLIEAIKYFGPVLAQLYGQTEAPMTISYLSKQDHDLNHPERLGSCGRALAGNQIALLDESLQPVADGEVGELCVRGPLVMAGYLNRPDENSKTLAGDWLHTGDLARRDAQGFLYLVDRAKDMVISGGFNVYSSEVENCLALHPAVAQSAVIGVPDARWGEAVTAIVVLRPGSQATAEELKAFVQQHKGPLCTPRTVDFRDALPLTAIGKIDKKTLRQAYWSAQGRNVH